MKKYVILCSLVFLTLFSFKLNDFFGKETVVYNSEVKGKTTKVTYILQTKDKNILIDKVSSNSITTMKYSDGYVLQEFKCKSEGEKTDYTFTLDNKSVIVEGLSKEKTFPKETISFKNNWVQEFNYGLRSFLESNDKEYHFIILNPDKFDSNDMIATKEGIETVNANNTTYNCQKVKTTLTGFKSHFWKAEIWYDLETKELIKYKANEGPGTPLNTITLDSKK